MNEDWSDDILDSFLEEVVSGVNPPDLTASILAALDQNTPTKSNSIQIESVGNAKNLPPIPEVELEQHADRSWWNDVVPAPPSQNFVEDLQGARNSSAQVFESRWQSIGNALLSGARQRSLTAILFGSLACSLALFGLSYAISWIDRESSNTAQIALNAPPRLPQAPSSNANTSKENQIAAEAIADSNTNNQVAKEVAPSANYSENLETEGLPFAIVDPEKSSLAHSADAQPPSTSRLTDEEIVSLINNQFVHLWERVGATKAKSVDDATWLNRSGQILLGSTPTPEQVDAFVNAAEKDKRLYVLEQAATSERFARKWSAYVTEAMLGATNQPKNERRAALESWVFQRLAQRTPYNEIVYRLLTATGTDDPSQPDFRPESHLLISLAGDDGRRVIEHLGPSVFNESLACSRCHDSYEDLQATRSNYWSLAASLGPLNVKPITAKVTGADGKEDEKRVIAWRLPADETEPSKELFFEQKDGRLQAAVPTLPDGQNVEQLSSWKRREALAAWAKSSQQLSESAVNFVWASLLGEPLVPSLGVSDDAGSVERKELLTALATQFRHHQYDLTKLVRWVAASQLFEAESRQLSERAWLLASDAEIQQWRKDESLFANFRSASDSIRSSDQLLARVVELKQKDGSKFDRRVLAQPSLQGSSIEALKKGLSETPLSSWVQDLRLHGSELDASRIGMVDRLLKSELSWELLVEHGLGHKASQRELDLASQILAMEKGDKRAALYQLFYVSQQSLIW